MKEDGYALNSQLIREYLEHISRADKDSNLSASRVRKYYRDKGGFVWIDTKGVDGRPGTVVSTLQARLPEMGFNTNVFNVKQISDDFERMQTLNFDEKNDINHVAARLEYNLTKAYLRYVTGQHFGFINPDPTATCSTSTWSTPTMPTRGQRCSGQPPTASMTT